MIRGRYCTPTVGTHAIETVATLRVPVLWISANAYDGPIAGAAALEETRAQHRQRYRTRGPLDEFDLEQCFEILQTARQRCLSDE